MTYLKKVYLKYYITKSRRFYDVRMIETGVGTHPRDSRLINLSYLVYFGYPYFKGCSLFGSEFFSHRIYR